LNFDLETLTSEKLILKVGRDAEHYENPTFTMNEQTNEQNGTNQQTCVFTMVYNSKTNGQMRANEIYKQKYIPTEIKFEKYHISIINR